MFSFRSIASNLAKTKEREMVMEKNIVMYRARASVYAGPKISFKSDGTAEAILARLDTIDEMGSTGAETSGCIEWIEYD